MNNNGVPLTIAVCCLWPVAVHLFLAYGWKFITQRDWKNINWDDLNPWKKQS